MRLLLPFLFVCTAVAQTYTISTFAGGGLPVNIAGTSAVLGATPAVAVDSSGNVFFVNDSTVLRLDAKTGILTLAAGNGVIGFSGDNGPAANAQLNNPQGIALDAAGILYIADTSNHRIRKVANGTITTVAGTGTSGFNGDNLSATATQLTGPAGVAVDGGGNLYIADTGSGRIRRVANGLIVTVAGSGVYGSIGDDGPATSAGLESPRAIALDSAGNLYISDNAANCIRKVANGIITTVAGNGRPTMGAPLGDGGPATSAQLGNPLGIAVDPAGNFYFADPNDRAVRKVAGGIITIVAGGGSPSGVALSPSGNLFIADGPYFNGRIRKVADGIITSIAGGGVSPAASGPATGAQLGTPAGLALDSFGNLYIADENYSRISEVANGTIAPFAGTGTPGFSGDNGPAAGAQLSGPLALAMDGAGDLFVADFANNRVRKVSSGVISTVAGNGTYGSLGDGGSAVLAQLYSPLAIAVDSAGGLYIADESNRIREVRNGVIDTAAGNGSAGFSGDNGPALGAQLNVPDGAAVDAAGNLYLSDRNNHCVRMVAKGIITTVAGNGSPGFGGDNGPATAAQLKLPQGIAVDSTGNLYIADTGNNRIRRVSHGVIDTLAGGGSQFGDNGPATAAQLNLPTDLALDAAGNIYISDAGNRRIRLLSPSSGRQTILVANPEGETPAIAPNTWIEIKGTNLAPPGDRRIWQTADFANGQMPTQLDGVSVTVNGQPAYVYFISPTQVNVLTPPMALPASVTVQLTNNGIATAPATVPASAYSPSLFVVNGGPYVTATHLDGSLVGPTTLYPGSTTPAKTGETIVLYANGFGPTNPPVAAGSPSQSGTLSPMPAVSIGGIDATVLYAGLVAPGEFQFNVVVPLSLSSGDQPIVATYQNLTTQSGVRIAIQP